MKIKHFLPPLFIFVLAVFMWSCKNPASPDNPKSDPANNGMKKLVTLWVYSDPWHANIWLDGFDTLKRTNDILYGVELGTHEIWILKPGFEDWIMTFTLTEEHTKFPYIDIIAQLTPVIITVTNPKSDSIWMKGQEALITWKPSYVPPAKASTDNGEDSLNSDGGGMTTSEKTNILHLPTVKIYLFKGDTLIKTIASEMENKGSYSWIVDPSLENGTDYKVRVNATPETERISLVFGDSEPFIIK